MFRLILTGFAAVLLTVLLQLLPFGPVAGRAASPAAEEPSGAVSPHPAASIAAADFIPLQFPADEGDPLPAGQVDLSGAADSFRLVATELFRQPPEVWAEIHIPPESSPFSSC